MNRLAALSSITALGLLAGSSRAQENAPKSLDPNILQSGNYRAASFSVW